MVKHVMRKELREHKLVCDHRTVLCDFCKTEEVALADVEVKSFFFQQRP